MNIKLHYLITFVSLFSLGLIAAKPQTFPKASLGERVCKESRGKMVCEFKFNENRIQTTLSNVQYN